jgi:hypothetical protein
VLDRGGILPLVVLGGLADTLWCGPTTTTFMVRFIDFGCDSVETLLRYSCGTPLTCDIHITVLFTFPSMQERRCNRFINRDAFASLVRPALAASAISAPLLALSDGQLLYLLMHSGPSLDLMAWY